MMIIVISLSFTLGVQAMVDGNGDIEMSDGFDRKTPLLPQLDNAALLEALKRKVAAQKVQDDAARQAKKLKDDADRKAQESIQSAFGTKLRAFYKAIRDSDVKAVEKQKFEITSDSLHQRHKELIGEPLSPTLVAFNYALQEKDPERFERRCQIFKCLYERKCCYSCNINKMLTCKTHASWGKTEPIPFLHYAVEMDNAAMVIFLLDSKIFSIQDVDCCDRTVLFFARSEGMAHMLMMRGVSIEQENNWGRCAYNADSVPKGIREQIRRVEGVEESWCEWLCG